MRRVSVVGSSGSGKSTFGRELARVLDVPYVELDAIHHLEAWTPIAPDDFVRRLEELTDRPGWVIDGNYRSVVTDGPVWERADTVVWLDVDKRVALWRVTKRTVARVITRRELWNGNRERLSNILSWDPERSMIRWVWTTHRAVRERFEQLTSGPGFAHLDIVRLRTPREVARWIESVSRPD